MRIVNWLFLCVLAAVGVAACSERAPETMVDTDTAVDLEDDSRRPRPDLVEELGGLDLGSPDSGDLSDLQIDDASDARFDADVTSDVTDAVDDSDRSGSPDVSVPDITVVLPDVIIDEPDAAGSGDVLLEEDGHACLPATSEDPLGPVVALRAEADVGSIVVSWQTLRTEHVLSYRLFMDGERVAWVAHERTDRVGYRVGGLDSTAEHTFFVRAHSAACRDGADSETITARSLRSFRLVLGEGEAAAGNAGTVDVFVSNSEPVTALSFDLSDSPAWVTVTDVVGDSGWSWTSGDDGDGASLSGVAAAPLAPGAEQRVGTIVVAALPEVSGTVRLTPTNVELVGATVPADTSDGRFVIHEE